MDTVIQAYLKGIDLSKACAVALGGSLPKAAYLHTLLAQVDCCVAADSGADSCLALGRLPEVLLGDFDSISPAALQTCKERGTKIEGYPAEKDFTDGELAMRQAVDQCRQRGLEAVCVLAAAGDRLDHMLANLFTGIGLVKAGLRVCYCFDHSLAHLFAGGPGINLEIFGKPQDTVSVLPLGGSVQGVTLEHLQYPLHRAAIPAEKAVGISNVMLTDRAKIYCEEGFLLVVQNLSTGD